VGPESLHRITARAGDTQAVSKITSHQASTRFAGALPRLPGKPPDGPDGLKTTGRTSMAFFTPQLWPKTTRLQAGNRPLLFF
jgi:hypothetical protein